MLRFRSSELRDAWAKGVLDERNQNLTMPQKELLLWHQRLSHCNLATIHNLCRHKRQTKARTEEDLKAIRDGQFLPCTHNVPNNSVCQNLICPACTIAKKAHRRKSSISPSSGAAPKEMILKEGHLSPGDCVSCDHYLSPVKGVITSTLHLRPYLKLKRVRCWYHLCRSCFRLHFPSPAEDHHSQ